MRKYLKDFQLEIPTEKDSEEGNEAYNSDNSDNTENSDDGGSSEANKPKPPTKKLKVSAMKKIKSNVPPQVGIVDFGPDYKKVAARWHDENYTILVNSTCDYVKDLKKKQFKDIKKRTGQLEKSIQSQIAFNVFEFVVKQYFENTDLSPTEIKQLIENNMSAASLVRRCEIENIKRNLKRQKIN
jgi:hypothetical protein